MYHDESNCPDTDCQQGYALEDAERLRAEHDFNPEADWDHADGCICAKCCNCMECRPEEPIEEQPKWHGRGDTFGECCSCSKMVPRETMHFSSGYQNGIGDGMFCCACVYCSGCGDDPGEQAAK